MIHMDHMDQKWPHGPYGYLDIGIYIYIYIYTYIYIYDPGLWVSAPPSKKTLDLPSKSMISIAKSMISVEFLVPELFWRHPPLEELWTEDFYWI